MQKKTGRLLVQEPQCGTRAHTLDPQRRWYVGLGLKKHEGLELRLIQVIEWCAAAGLEPREMECSGMTAQSAVILISCNSRAEPFSRHFKFIRLPMRCYTYLT